MSPTSPDRSKEAEALLSSGAKTDEPSASPPASRPEKDNPPGKTAEDLSAEERQEKLKSIRQAIDAGAYDSDEMLANAMNRMRKAIENEAEPQ